MVNRRPTLVPLNPQRRRSPLSSFITIVVLVLVVLVGGLWFLSTLATEKPLTRVEKTVSNETLAQ